MAMNSTYLNAIANHGASLITHIGLVNGSGTELSSVSYARHAVTWTSASSGTVRPNANLDFSLTSGDVVAGWRGYSASSGGTNYGGATLSTVTMSADGTYTLIAASTGIPHTST